MSDRLPELRRQRALVADHLAWLDRQIAAVVGETPATSVDSPPPTSLPPPAHPGAAGDLPSAERILAEFRGESESSPARTRRGCLWSFVGGMAFLILSGVAIYWLRYR